MGNNDFNSSIPAKISAAEAIKKINNVSEWWGVTFTGSSGKQNDKFTVNMGGDAFFDFSVAELIPGKRVVWLVTDCYMPWYSDKKEWANTLLIFDVNENDGLTELNFRHKGLTPDIECYKDCERGWTHWIQTSLFSYLNNGKGVFDKSMVKKDFKTTIELEKSSQDIFKAITSDVPKWWGGQDLKGSSTALNDEFVIHHPGAHYSKQKLVEIIPDKKVVWLVTESELSWLDKDKQEWTNTKMIFEIVVEGDKTRLFFTHEGLVPEKECYERCAHEGWGIVIKDYLFNFINTGNAI